MAIRKQIVKMNHVEAVVKVVNDGVTASTTIDLDVDLLKSNEFKTPGKTQKVAIAALEWSVAQNNEPIESTSGNIQITRNSVLTHNLYATRDITMSYGADHEQSASDITVTMTAGTLYMRLLKVDGYTPDFRPEQFGGEDPH
jgi:hypothetical protein